MVVPVTLGERLRQIRIEAPYVKLREMAREVGVDFPTLSRYECDRERPTSAFLLRFAEATGADKYELLGLLDAWVEAPPPDLNAPGVFICRRPS